MDRKIDRKISSADRNIGLEILRICSMILIILLHSIDHSGVYERLIVGTSLYYYEMWLYAAVQVSVNLFVLISGYFLVNSTFRLKKLGFLWVEVVFYSLIIKLVMMLLGEIPFSAVSLVSCLFPVLTGRYWFVTIYFGMYLLFPFFNIAVKAMTKAQHRGLVIMLVLLFSVWPSIHPSLAGMNSGGAWGLAWFTVLYFVAAYLKEYYVADRKSLKWFILFLLCPAVMTLCLFIANQVRGGILQTIVLNWWRYDSVFALTASISLFLAALNLKIKNGTRTSGWIIKISGSTFGVYLIHAHANICTESMWQRIGMVSGMQYRWFPIYQIFVVVVIFMLCMILDWARQALFRMVNVNALVSKISDLIEKQIKGTIWRQKSLS